MVTNYDAFGFLVNEKKEEAISPTEIRIFYKPEISTGLKITSSNTCVAELLKLSITASIINCYLIVKDRRLIGRLLLSGQNYHEL